jgi:predicted  nucleic acid-binding Zn-ribbon protein
LKENLKALVELQAVDDRIADLGKKLAGFPARLEVMRAGYLAARTVLAEHKAWLESAGKERRAAERELEAHEAKIKKLKDQQFMVKTNKEYQAMNHEIALEEQKKGAYEETVLSLMEKGAEVEKAITIQEAGLAREEERFSLEEKKLLAEKAALESELAEAGNERRAALGCIGEQHLRLYNRIREFHKGKAVAMVVEGVCQGCYVGLRPQKYQELKRGEQILTCDECRRIIYNQEISGDESGGVQPKG